jgi:elongation factor P
MVLSNQLIPGMTISIDNKLFRIESSVKVTVPKGVPFIKVKLRNLETNDSLERNFKLNQQLKEVALVEGSLEFLYLEGKDFLFLGIDTLDQILVPQTIVGSKANYLKEGVEVKACFYGDKIFSIELPQFLELMVSKVENNTSMPVDNGNGITKVASLETGARIEVPLFIEVGDIIKIDTRSDEYIQRM